MYPAGGPIAWFGRWKTVPPVAFHRAENQPTADPLRTLELLSPTRNSDIY